MAVARMLKVTLVGYSPTMDHAVSLLQDAGVIAVTPAVAEGEEPPEGLRRVQVGRDDARLRSLEEYHADAAFVRQFLDRYHTVEAPFSAFISEKVHLDAEDFKRIEPDASFVELYRECETLADEMATLTRERERTQRLIEELTPWEGFHLQISQWKGTEHVVLFTGTVPALRGPDIRQALREAVPEVTVDELGPVGNRQAWVVMAHVSRLDEVRGVLALTDFSEVAFPGLSDYPAEEISVAAARVEAIERRLIELEQRASGLAQVHYHEAVALVEMLDTKLEALAVRESFGETASTFVLTGWIRESRRDDLAEALEPLEGVVDVDLAPPAPGDQPPVELQNPALLRPFEVLTDLYGRPRYDEVDPTPLLAPFFWLFFGITIADVGYGLMLIAAAYYIKARLDVAPGVKRFMDLLMLGGVAAMMVGVLFGSWFAIDLEALPASLDWFRAFVETFQILNPLEQIQEFLIFTLVLGLLQVVFGVLVAAWDAFRRGDAAAAVSEQLSILFLFGMIAVAVLVPGAARWAIVIGIGLTIVLQGRAFEAARWEIEVETWDRWLGAGWMALLVGFIGALAFGAPGWMLWAFAGLTVVGAIVSRVLRRSALSLFGGAYAVYGMTSFLGDVLSYSRLAALSLSGVLVGAVFNLLGSMIWSAGGGPVVKIIVVVLGVVVVAVGHVFNVVVNLLGAFVHPARLQFVEFFSKFYQGGGKPFDPFRYRTKQLVLHAGGRRREGGAGS